MKLTDVIKKPLITEKAMMGKTSGNPTYAFVVDLHADKPSIRAAVEQLFKVHVTRINTSVVRGKIKRVGRSMGKRSNYKKAIVEIKAGEKIEIFEAA